MADRAEASVAAVGYEGSPRQGQERPLRHRCQPVGGNKCSTVFGSQVLSELTYACMLYRMNVSDLRYLRPKKS